MSHGFYRFRFLFFFIFLKISLTNTCLPCRLRKAYSEQPTVLLARGHLNTMLLTNFENLNSILNILQEPHVFSVLTNPVIICIYLGTTDKHFRDQGNVLHPTSNLITCDLSKNLIPFETLLCDFCCPEGISCSNLVLVTVYAYSFKIKFAKRGIL